MKAPYIGYSQNEESIDMMKKIKTLFDPKGIMVSRLNRFVRHSLPLALAD
jgi:FAD/FMN-containing dehydrogenase